MDAIYQDYKSQGVKFFAVNAAEDKDTVQKFLGDNKLFIPVLLDLDGKATDKFVGDGGIPLTVVVGPIDPPPDASADTAIPPDTQPVPVTSLVAA